MRYAITPTDAKVVFEFRIHTIREMYWTHRAKLEDIAKQFGEHFSHDELWDIVTYKHTCHII
jgi:hypothetical protein